MFVFDEELTQRYHQKTTQKTVNRYALGERDGRLVHHSDYRDMPPEWLGPRFLAGAAALRERDPLAYRHEYLGEVVGHGGAVFENIRCCAISDAEIAGYDGVLYGVDWGWYPDPWAFNACFYDPARRLLYLFDELTERRMSNRDTANLLLARGLRPGDSLIADSAEPKSVGDYRAFGLPCRAAAKGPGSVAAGIKWMQGLAGIVIDPRRCPDTATEFLEYEYERDARSGEILGRMPDAGNHHIDAVRYACAGVWRRRGG